MADRTVAGSDQLDRLKVAIFDLDDGPVEEVVFVEAPEDTTDWCDGDR